MELRQLRYFVAVVQHGSLSQAAAALGVVPSALSQQISRLEGELSTRLLQRSSSGVRPTEAGIAFQRQAQLTLRHADDAVRAAQLARLSGHVSVGLPPTTSAMLGLPLMQAMRERYPQVQLHLVESLSGHLAQMLVQRQLDLAILFRAEPARRWSVTPLLEEQLFVMGEPALLGAAAGGRTRLSALGALPLVLPSASHNLRTVIDSAFARARCQPNVVAEIDGLGLLMQAVAAGWAATLQPGAALARLPDERLASALITDAQARRPNLLVSLSDDELSPAALAARVVVAEIARDLVGGGRWPGARPHGG